MELSPLDHGWRAHRCGPQALEPCVDTSVVIHVYHAKLQVSGLYKPRYDRESEVHMSRDENMISFIGS